MQRTLTVDKFSRRVRVDDTEIALTFIEMELLFTLAKQVGRAYSRSQLLKEVWDIDAGMQVETRTVDAHIYRLRKKIGADWIGHVASYGYRLEPNVGTILVLEETVATTTAERVQPHTFIDAVGGTTAKASVEVHEE